MKRVATITIVLLALALGGTLFYLKGKRYEVVITQAQIDKALKERFPVSKHYLLVFAITYSNPQLNLLPGTNRIQVGLDAQLNFRMPSEEKKLGGGATLTSSVSYKSETQQFFLSDVQFERLEVQGIPPKYLDKVMAVASQTAREYVEKQPIYTLRADDVGTTAAKLLLKEVHVKDSEVHLLLGL